MSHTITAYAGATIALALIPLSVSADHALPEGYVPTASVTAEHSCVIETDLGVGSRGDAVSCLQKHLIEDEHLALPAPTGYFGEMTKAAVAAWQKEKGVASTGFFGALSRTVFAGSEGDHEAEVAHTEEAPHTPHPAIDVSAWPSVPSVSIVIHPDAMSGYNLEIQTQNFTFAPQHASTAALPNEGHAHLMVGGKKLARVYGNWFHIPAEAVPVGESEVLVTLNANDHSDLEHEHVRIAATSTITK